MTTLTRIYGQSFVVYWQQARALLLPAIVIFVVAGIPLGLMAEADGTHVVDLVLALLSVALGTATVVLYTGYIDEVADGARKGAERVPILPTVRETLPVIWPLVVASFLYVGTILGGFVLVILPGLYFAARFGLVSTIVSLERQSALAGMKKSWRMTRGHSWLAFATIVIPFAVESFASEAAVKLGTKIAANDTIGHIVGDAVASTIVAPMVGLAMAHTYFMLREESK